MPLFPIVIWWPVFPPQIIPLSSFSSFMVNHVYCELFGSVIHRDHDLAMKIQSSRFFRSLLTHMFLSSQCKVCMQTFICTTTEVKCREHAEAKHPKSDLYACFPHLKKWHQSMTADNGSMNSSCSSCDCGQVWSFCVAVCALLGYSSTRTYYKTFSIKHLLIKITLPLLRLICLTSCLYYMLPQSQWPA